MPIFLESTYSSIVGLLGLTQLHCSPFGCSFRVPVRPKSTYKCGNYMKKKTVVVLEFEYCRLKDFIVKSNSLLYRLLVMNCSETWGSPSVQLLL
jgi:hypothetical protein